MTAKTFRALLILGVLVFFVLIPIFIYSRVATVWEVFDKVVRSFTEELATPIWLTRGIVVLLILPFLWGLERTFAFSGRHRRAGLMVVVAYVSLYCFAMYGLERDANVSHKDGRSKKWYCISPEGYRVFDSPGYDPKYGLPLEPVTKEVIPLIEQQRRGGVTAATDGPVYFDPTSRRPLKWYWRSPEGRIELFDHPGFHPRYQDALREITPDIIREIEASERRGVELEKRRDQQRALAGEEERRVAREVAFRDRYISATPRDRAGIGTIVLAVAAAGSSGAAPGEPAFVGAIARELQRAGYTVRDGVLSTAAFSDGIVNRLAAGDRELMAQLGLDRVADHILVCRQETEYSEFRQLQHRITCKSSLQCNLVPTAGGSPRSEFVSGAGLGSTREEASANSAEVVGAALGEKLASIIGH
ncbi:MAG: hypothetical protein IPH09_16775 [bacterium]|nr:hypothetical protein [bacterium]